MQQQINLYQPEDAIPREPFSASIMLVFVAITLVLMLSFYAMLEWKKAQLQTDIAELRMQSEQIQAVVEKLELTVSNLTDSKKEQQQIAYFKKVYTSKQLALDELSSMVSGNSVGVSAYFSALARTNMQEIWFNKIDVYSGGSEIMLEGATTDARSLTVLLNKLKDEPVFKGVSFRLFKAQRDESKPVLHFTMQTQLPTQENMPSQLN